MVGGFPTSWKVNAGVTSKEGTFTGSAGDAIEQQWSGSWQHPKPRSWFVVSEEGELGLVASTNECIFTAIGLCVLQSH